MRALPDFEWQRPAALAEALALLADDGSVALAGGTDLVPNLRRGLGAPRRVVDLGALPALQAIECHAGGWRLGARVTLDALARHGELAQALPAIGQAAASVAGPAHRSVATLAGNLLQDTRCVYYNQSAWWRQANAWCLKRDGDTCHVAPQGGRCHAAFEGDLAPVLLVYGAEAEIASHAGTRRAPLASLYRDDGAAHLTLARGELVTALHLPHPAPGSASAYRKLRARAAMDFPLAGVAMRLLVRDGRLTELAVALTGTNSHPLLLAGTDALLGRAVDEALATQLGKLVGKQASPMRSTVTASNHRRLVAMAAARRLLEELGTREAP